MNNRRNILIILSSLLFLTLSGLVAWYVFFYRCKNLPEQYSKFEKYVTNNDCSSTTVFLKGTLYNIRREDKNLRFDISAWDTASKKAEKFTDIVIPYDENTATQLKDIQYMAPVELTLNLEKKYKYDLILDNNLTEKWTLKKITYSKSDYLQYLRDLFYVITFNAIDMDGKTFPYSVLSSVEMVENGERSISTIGENNLASFYRMYVLLSGTKNKEIDFENLFSDFSISSYMDALTDFLENNVTDEYSENPLSEDTILLENGYFGGCTLVKDLITEYDISNTEKEKLVKEYCNIGKVGEILTNIKRLSFSYTNNDFLSSINTNRLQESKYNEEELINTFLSSDLLATAELISTDKSQKDEIYNLSSLLIENSILQQDESINLKNFCSLLNSNYFSKKLFNQDPIIAENTYRILLDQDIAKMTEYMSNDLQAGLLCLLPESSDKYIEEFNNAILAKYLEVNWFDSSEEKDHALWDGNVYRIIDNSRLYQLLLRYYENSK